MTEENVLINLISSIRTLKNFPSYFHLLKEILDTVEQESISNLHPCSKFLIGILKKLFSGDELKPNSYWFGNCKLIDDSESSISLLNLAGNHSLFELKLSQTNPFTEKMEYYRLKNQYTDLSVTIGHRAFPVHKIVLQDTCSKWNELLENREQSEIYTIELYKGRELNRLPAIDLTSSVNSDIFDKLLTFFYTSKVTMTLNEAPEFCSAFKFFNILEAFNRTVAYLNKNVKLENAIEVYCLSERLNIADLNKQSLKVIVDNTKWVFDNKRVIEYHVEVLGMLFHGLNKQGTNNNSLINKEHMFNALISWAKADPSTRELHVPKLLEFIPENSLSEKFLKKTAADHEYNRLFCERYLTDLKQGSPAERLQNNPKTPVKIEWLTYKLFCFGGYDNQNQLQKSVSCFDFDTRKWKLSTPIHTLSAYSGGVAVGNKVYICGGWSSRSLASDAFQSFDCTTEMWTILRPMPEPRWGCAMAVIDEFIYVSGGHIENKTLATVFRYCIKSGVWETICSMNDCRAAHQLVSLDGYLYAIGGFCTNSLVEQYDPNHDKWQVLEQNQGRKLCYAGSTILDGKIYICGDGFFEEYTPNSSDPWRSFPALNGIDGTFLVSYCGRFFAMGGGTKGGTANVMKFDGQWSEQEDMKMDVPRHYHCSFVVRC